MINKDEADAIAKATEGIIKEIPIYQDTIQPVAQEVGKALKTLGGVINVALAPIAAMVYGYETIKNQLRRRLETRLSKTPPENIVTPQLQVVGPLLEKYKYIHDNEELSGMFINLLANAMDKNQTQKAHPSFVNVISELSPDEARLIKTISAELVLPKLDLRLNFKKEKSEDKTGHVYIYVNFTLLGEKAALQHPELTPSYISNLERLSIISAPIGDFSESYVNDEHYKPLENDTVVTKLKEKLKEKGEIEIVRGTISITDFGRMFMEAVLN